jgi:DNA-binding Lrp family transcriptional regulator
MAELNIKDKKIIVELSKNARQSSTKIAKKVGISKDLAVYKIKNLLTKGSIRRVITIINTERLGFHRYEVFIQLKNIDEKKEKEIAEYLAKNPMALWVRSALGKWDILAEFYTKDILDFEKLIRDISNKLRNNIEKINSSRVIVEHAYPLKCIGNNINEPLIQAQTKNKSNLADIDDKDIKILRELSKNAKINVIDISKNTGINTDTIIYRIKKMTNNNIILGYRVVMNETFLGLNRYKLLISIKDIDDKKYDLFIEFLNSIKSTQYIKKCIGDWNFSITILSKDMDELRRIVLDIRNYLGESLEEYKLLLLFEEYKNNYFPEGIDIKS